MCTCIIGVMYSTLSTKPNIGSMNMDKKPKQRSIVFSKRHDDLLQRLSHELGVTYTECLQRALEALEIMEARRKAEVEK